MACAAAARAARAPSAAARVRGGRRALRVRVRAAASKAELPIATVSNGGASAQTTQVATEGSVATVAANAMWAPTSRASAMCAKGLLFAAFAVWVNVGMSGTWWPDHRAGAK